MAFDRERMKNSAAALAAKGKFIGTSGWKYDGWFGQLYIDDFRITRCGKLQCPSAWNTTSRSIDDKA